MTSPYSTSGGGIYFEARVVAYYLAAILGESPARGVPGQYAVQALTQRAEFGDPLDDIIVTGLLENGKRGKLHLQIKSDLSFTPSDTNWVTVLHQAWDTYENSFDADIDRLGIAINTYSARADKHYQTVLKWAAHSVSGEHFIERINKKDFSHKDKRVFVDNIRSILESYAPDRITDDAIWTILRSFVILHFDFELKESSRDAESVLDRLRSYLPDAQRQKAVAIWDHLIVKAGELTPVGGGATRSTLVQQLSEASISTCTATSSWKDLQIIEQESRKALLDIKSDIHDFRLYRSDVYERIKQAFADGRFIQIDGEPGTGKSALLREIAEEFGRDGPIFVLKDSRIHPRGWGAHANVLSVSLDAAALLRELGAAGEPILFIDGIDKVTDPAVQLTINDLIRTIATEPALSRWKVLSTVREQNLEHIGTWLDPDALRQLPVRTVTVPLLKDSELTVILENFPRLKPLALDSGDADVILRRPFFLDSVLTLAGIEGTADLPATEVELLKLWWKLGGSECSDFAQAQHRRNTLLELAKRLSTAPYVPISIGGLKPEALEELKGAGVLRDKELGHSVVFAHDIYEEWALAELLLGRWRDMGAFLHEIQEPQLLVRPMQLLGSYLLESNNTEADWIDLHSKLSDPGLRPVWQRSVLTSCIKSTRAQQLLSKLEGFLGKDDHAQLKSLLIALRTIEVVPNPAFLNEEQFPDLDPDERVKFAHHTALPKLLTWIRFLNWFMAQPKNHWAHLLPDLLPVFATWQNACSGQNIHFCRKIGEAAHGWLVEFEAARHPDQWNDRRNPLGIDLEYDNEEQLEISIRSLFLSSAGDVPNLVAEYLKDHGSRERTHIFREKIMANSVVLARHVPSDLVDYILSASLEHPQDREDRRSSHSDYFAHNLGITDHHTFYPASPVQPPFLLLLQAHESEGLRLIRALCNHSISVWQWDRERSDNRHEPVTPIPVKVGLPWGTQTFWGDGQVYLWFRGIWANAAVGSALMAMEKWALDELDSGRSFDDVFRVVVEGNETVAALGLAVSLCLAHPEKSLECALPLITCPHVWNWDISRFVHDQDETPSNEIGDWHRFRHLLTAVRDLNRKPHRKQDIRALVPYFVFHKDDKIKERYTHGIQQFVDLLPFELKEETTHPATIATLQEQMKVFAEQADPQYWKIEPTEDGRHYMIWNDPPSLKSKKYIQQREEHNRLNECMALSLWANKCLKTSSIDSKFTIDEGIARAKALDASDLFEELVGAGNILRSQRQSAVAGTAFVAAKLYDGDRWDDVVGPWCLNVLQRAAAAPESSDTFSVRSSILSMHPVVFAVHGFSALLKRGYQTRECQLALLSLAVDAVEGVVEAVSCSSAQYTCEYPEYSWVLFDLLVRQCIVREDAIPNYHSMVWDDAEAEQKSRLLDLAAHSLENAIEPTLPDIPLPWIRRHDFVPPLMSETEGYERNDSVFLWNLAEKAILQAPSTAILPNTHRRSQFVRLVGQLTDLTMQEIIPPFAQSRRDHYGNTPFEWVSNFFNWCGRLSTQLTLEEVQAEILSRVLATDDEAALLAMQSFIPAYMIEAFLLPPTIDDQRVLLWEEIAEWIFENREGNRIGRHLSNDFTTCALATLFCVQRDFQPLLCGIEEGWPHLRRFEAIIQRAVVQFGTNSTLYIAVVLFFKKGGFDLLPDPGLEWLRGIVVAMKQDQEFWRSNGDDTVEILKMLLEKKGHALDRVHWEAIALMSDVLVDNGVRGAGFLQQERMRSYGRDDDQSSTR